MSENHTQTQPRIRILIVEDEPELLDLTSLFLQSEFNAEIIEARHGLEAKKILELDPHFNIVISDYNMPELDGGELLSYVRSLALPIQFILVSAVDHSKALKLKNLTPDATIPKPIFIEPLLRAIHQFTDHLITNTPTEDYISASIDHLFRFGSVPYPLFAQLTDRKFVKVLHENDFFGTEELERFRKKKITHLYIETKHSQNFFKKQMDAFLALSQNKNLSQAELTVVNEHISSVVQEMSLIFGFSKELEFNTKKTVDQAYHTIISSPVMKGALKNSRMPSGNPLVLHSSRLPYLANHLIQIMGWNSETSALKMAFASLLHDATLNHQIHASYEFDPELIETAKKELSVDQYHHFINHPLKAAEVAAQFGGIPSDVDTIIAQHHENCMGTGFPYRLNHTRIAPLSCAFIVAHDILCYYERVGDQFKMENFLELKQDQYCAGHFRRILLELIFTKK